jgi:hypothetical protein
MDVKITQLSSNHNRVRTREIVGECTNLPVEGKTFLMFAEPIDKSKSTRMLHTTKLKSVRKEDNAYYFKTQNSEYKLEVKSG